MAYGRQSRKKRDVHQVIFDDFTKCKGLTQEELDDDLKLLKLAQYTTPSTKYKISNPISAQKRELITSLYDQKNISCDLAKDNNQLLRDLNALKKHIQKIKDDIVHNETQMTISNVQKEMVQRQFDLVQKTKNKQIESLQKYQNECKNSIAQIQTGLCKIMTNTTQSATTEHQLSDALQYIKDLRAQLKNKKEIINILKQKEINDKDTSNSNSNSNSIALKLSEKIDSLENKNTEERRINAVLRRENVGLNRELEECKESYRNLFKMHKHLNHELSKTKYEANNELNKFHQEKTENQHEMNLIQNECIKYQQMTKSLMGQQKDNELLNASVCIDYYKALVMNDGFKKGNGILQQCYNELETKYKKLNEIKGNEILQDVIREENRKNESLSQQLYGERQKYVDRVFQFKDDLETLYRKTESTAAENIKMKQETKKKTFELQRENDKLRETLKQSHSNLRVRETETQAKHKEKEEQHQETVKVMKGSKVDLEKRVDVLKCAIKDLNGALSDCHIQMLSFQKQVFDEMKCSIPKDDHLMMNNSKKKKKKKKKFKNKKRQISIDIVDPIHPKRQKIDINHNHNHNHIDIADDIVDDIDISSSSEVSHADEEQYTFQDALENLNETQSERIFYSILTNTKTDGYILLNDYIKITRRGHPDYTGRVETMFFDEEQQKKKVCVTIFQLISDIPNIHECIHDNDYDLGKREYVQLVLSKKHKQFKKQKENTKIFGVGRIHTNKKVTLWFPKRHLQFKAIEKKTSGRDVYFCRYKYDKNNKTLTRIDGTDDQPQIDYQ